MNFRITILIVLSSAGIACATRSAPTTYVRDASAPGAARLTVTILGLKSEEGEVAVALYDSAESFKKRSQAVAKGRVTPTNGVAVWTAEDLRSGVYAVAVYHDRNANGVLDRSTLGPPDEPYGFSNNARGTFGPPRFEKAAIEIGPGEHRIEITLR